MQKQITYLLRLIAAIFLFCMVSSGTHAATYVWPGPAPPCNTTLQYCINNVAPGDTVEIAVNTVDESLTIDKSLTLKPASGYFPRFGDVSTVNTIVVNSTGAANNAVTIEGLTIAWGGFLVTHSSSGTFTLNLLNNTIEKSISTSAAIRFWPINGGMTYFNISSNNITVPVYDQAHGIQLHATSNMEGSLNNNVIVMEGATQGSAIEVTNIGAASAVVDIIGNTIAGTNMNNGIFIYQYTSGCNTDTIIANNLITGQAGNTGGPGAIAYYITNGIVSLQVINNTVADNEEGIELYCDAGTATGKIANNIIANNTSTGLYIDSNVGGAVSNNHNLVYNNGSNGFIAGVGTLFVDPSFVRTGDYRLQPGSVAVNNGDNASVPSGITTDLAGNPRIFRLIVDIGAYERGNCITPVLPLLLL